MLCRFIFERLLGSYIENLVDGRRLFVVFRGSDVIIDEGS